MPKITDLAYAAELGTFNYIVGVCDGKVVRFDPIMLKGTDGTSGSVWTSSASAPSSSAGADNDFHLNTATGDIFKKISGTWTVVLNIQSSGSGGETVAAVGGLNIYLQSTYGGF